MFHNKKNNNLEAPKLKSCPKNITFDLIKNRQEAQLQHSHARFHFVQFKVDLNVGHGKRDRERERAVRGSNH